MQKNQSRRNLETHCISGYDSDKFLAPDDVYAKLPECCQYERVNKTVAKGNVKNDTSKMDHAHTIRQ
jgi:hypothetical protein